jgi:hypothetical protein
MQQKRHVRVNGNSVTRLHASVPGAESVQTRPIKLKFKDTDIPINLSPYGPYSPGHMAFHVLEGGGPPLIQPDVTV